VTEGRGIVAAEDEEYVITPGCIVYIPAGQKHWHGATAESSMTHLNVQKAGIHLAK
jgi:quercetin dioxygenase-like cupin family protein